MLTTKDNPYSPDTEWDKWWSFDISAGYHTYEMLDRYLRAITDDDRMRFKGNSDEDIAEHMFLADNYLTHIEYKSPSES